MKDYLVVWKDDCGVIQSKVSIMTNRDPRSLTMMEFTDEELQFLQRLIGHHLTANSCPEGLYDKIALNCVCRGIYSKKPLPLEAPENSFYRDRIFLRLKTKV